MKPYCQHGPPGVTFVFHGALQHARWSVGVIATSRLRMHSEERPVTRMQPHTVP